MVRTRDGANVGYRKTHTIYRSYLDEFVEKHWGQLLSETETELEETLEAAQRQTRRPTEHDTPDDDAADDGWEEMTEQGGGRPTKWEACGDNKNGAAGEEDGWEEMTERGEDRPTKWEACDDRKNGAADDESREASDNPSEADASPARKY